METRNAYPLRFLARVTLEAETPFHIGSGSEWQASDAGIVTDANGLPTIPGTAIAGVLRHATRAAIASTGNGKHNAEDLFGCQSQTGSRDQSRGSRLTFSFACIHDGNNRPVVGILPAARLNDTSDPVISNALKPTLRDHARHDANGVVHDGGKFDDLVVCAGHRFTFEIELVGRESDRGEWENLLRRFGDPVIRFGGKTSRGLGKFRVEEILTRTFDLAVEFEAYEAHPGRLDVTVDGWIRFSVPRVQRQTIDITINPAGFWMFGGGIDPDTDMVPVRDRYISWSPIGKEIVAFSLPGSALKGALRHRALFLAYANAGYFGGKEDGEAKTAAEMLVASLFGNEPKTEKEDLQRGELLFSDLLMEETTPSPLQNHVSIDRFTGGARDQALFDEAPLFQGTQLKWTIELRRDLTTQEHSLLEKLLTELTESRLQLGGGTGRGHGYFTGTFKLPSITAS